MMEQLIEMELEMSIIIDGYSKFMNHVGNLHANHFDKAISIRQGVIEYVGTSRTLFNEMNFFLLCLS
mgnify:CR=1 FL=1